VGLNQTVNNETAQRIARNLTEFYKQQFNTSIANVEATVLFSVRRESIAIGIQVAVTVLFPQYDSIILADISNITNVPPADVTSGILLPPPTVSKSSIVPTSPSPSPSPAAPSGGGDKKVALGLGLGLGLGGGLLVIGVLFYKSRNTSSSVPKKADTYSTVNISKNPMFLTSETEPDVSGRHSSTSGAKRPEALNRRDSVA